MVNWEPITYKDLIILTEWMAQEAYSAAQLAEAVREPAKYAEELRAVVRQNAELAASQLAQDKSVQKVAAAEFLAARAAKHGITAAKPFVLPAGVVLPQEQAQNAPKSVA